ncbi:MAG: hypothetical protein ABSG71_16225 [Thermodesulfobacteriota bacterium]
MITMCPLRAITQAPTPHAMAALHAATLAVLIDLIFKFSDYRALLHVLPVAGCVKFSGTFMLVFLQVIVDVPEFLVVDERYGQKGLLAGIRPGIRVSHLNNFATLLDLMGVPIFLRVRLYDRSIFSLTAEDNRVRYYMSGSLHGFVGNYVVKRIPTPPDKGWGVSRPVGKGPESE